MTDTTAIVVTYNSTAQIGECLRALRAAGVRTVVVDNNSADDTADRVEREHPEVQVVRNPANLGFAGGVNRGLATVTTPYTLLVNPDCVVPPRTADGLVEHLRRHPGTGITGPRLYGVDGQVAISAHPFESLTSVVASRFGGSLVPVQVRRLASGAARRRTYDACLTPSAPVAVDWLSGACLALRTSLLRDIGGLDERYFLYYEDEELCWQAGRRGAAVVYLPRFEALHVGGASTPDPGNSWPHLYYSMLVFFDRHRTSSYQAVRAAVLARAVLGLGLATLRRARRDPAGPPRIRAWRQVAAVALAGTRRDTP